LQRQFEAACSKVEAKATMGAQRVTKVEHQGYWQEHKDRIKFFREFLLTLAPNAFHQEGYFEAYVKHIKDCHQAWVEG